MDSLGRERKWTEPELDEMANSYNSIVGTLHDAPVLISHEGRTMVADQNLPPGTFRPPTPTITGEAAYGWIARAYREGLTLKGDYAHLNPDFARSLFGKQYRKRSISIYPPDHPSNPTPGKLNIRHIAYVGIPAVKGLADHHEHKLPEDSGIGFWDYEETPMVQQSPDGQTANTSFSAAAIDSTSLDPSTAAAIEHQHEETVPDPMTKFVATADNPDPSTVVIPTPQPATFKTVAEFTQAWKDAETNSDPTLTRTSLCQAALKMKLAMPQSAKEWWVKNHPADHSEPSDFAALRRLERKKAAKETADHSETSDFSAPTQIADLFSGLRDRLISEKGIETADQVIPKTALELLRSTDQPSPTMDDFRALLDRVNIPAPTMDDFRSLSDRVSQAFDLLMQMKAEDDAEDHPLQSPFPNHAEELMTKSIPADQPDWSLQFSEMQTQVNALTTALAESKSQVSLLTADKLKLSAEREIERVTNFAEGLIANRKMLPANKARKIALLLGLSNATPLQFGEGDDSQLITPRQAWMDDLAAGPELWSSKQLPTGPEHAPEFAEKETRSSVEMDPDSVRLDYQIRAYCAEKKLDPSNHSDYADAMDALNIYV